MPVLVDVAITLQVHNISVFITTEMQAFNRAYVVQKGVTFKIMCWSATHITVVMDKLIYTEFNLIILLKRQQQHKIWCHQIRFPGHQNA